VPDPAGGTAYLGPPGTFCEQALALLPAGLRTGPRPCPTVADALDAVRTGHAVRALVPYENSSEGSVAGTLDDLARPDAAPLVIAREVLLPVRFALLARPGSRLVDVREVSSIGPAVAQCRAWLRAHLPGVQVTAAASTAEAARRVAAGQPGSTPDAAIAAPVAAATYGLTVLADDVGDAAAPVTRFVLVTRPAPVGAPTGGDRTTVVLYERDDHPGALLAMLTELATRGVNLTRLESRPTGQGLGSYCFAVDLDGSVMEPRIAEALGALHRLCARVTFLGTYPRADGLASRAGPWAAEEDFAAARGWLAALQSGKPVAGA